MKRKAYIIIFVIIVFILMLRFCRDPFANHLTKKQIFSLVARNEELLKSVQFEVQSLSGDILSISTSEKVIIYDPEYEYVQGLYICRKVGGRYVYENIDNGVFMEVMKLEGIRRISIQNDLLIFSCGGRGFGSATSYYGFNYYINPITSESYYFGPEYMKSGKGWFWKEENGDNSVYYERIVDNFYYYEEHY